MDFFEKYKVKTFDDLVFKPHRNYFNVGAIHAVMEFPNGHAISVVGGGTGLYGDGETTFEVWTSWQEDVQGYCTKDEVTELMLLTQYKSEKNQIVGFIV
jgi:hypothetical protein